MDRNSQNYALIQIKELFQTIGILSLDENAIIKSAQISAEVMQKGRALADPDCLIAGIALANNINTIVTGNIKHFERIRGINIETY